MLPGFRYVAAGFLTRPVGVHQVVRAQRRIGVIAAAGLLAASSSRGAALGAGRGA